MSKNLPSKQKIVVNTRKTRMIKMEHTVVANIHNTLKRHYKLFENVAIILGHNMILPQLLSKIIPIKRKIIKITTPVIS